MISPDTTHLLGDEAALMRHLSPNDQLCRAAFAGQPFVSQPIVMGHLHKAQSFSEELVLRLIGRGLLVTLQATQEWIERGIPARPFTVRLSPIGIKVRNSLIKHSRTVTTTMGMAA